MTIVIGVLNNFKMSCRAIKYLVENMQDPASVQLIVIDNGSDTPFLDYVNSEIGIGPLARTLNEFMVVRNDQNVGNYPLFKQGLDVATGDVIAFLHSDVFVYDRGWDSSVLAQFEANESLGLVGFIGSTEIDSFGGRGSGTVSNFQGLTVDQWAGSKAEVHGRRDKGFIIDGSVVDGCVMIFRKKTLETIGFKDPYPPHHFYDRMMSCQVLEVHQKVGILGVAFDHFSGQTANHEQKYQDTAQEWFKKYLDIDTPQDWAALRAEWVKRGNNPSKGTIPNQWDHCTYLEAEYRFLTEYRDQKRIVPCIMGRPIN